MDSQWHQYSSDQTQRPNRYPHPQMHPQANGSSQQLQPGNNYNYDAGQHTPSSSHLSSMAVSPAGTPHKRTFSSDVDVQMEDADPYNSMKYPPRPTHHQRPSGQFLAQQDPSRRYSPSKAISPASSYTPTSSQSAQSPYSHFAPHSTSARQSPTRSTPYATPNQSYYSTPSKFSYTSPCWLHALRVANALCPQRIPDHRFSLPFKRATLAPTHIILPQLLRSSMLCLVGKPNHRAT